MHGFRVSDWHADALIVLHMSSSVEQATVMSPFTNAGAGHSDRMAMLLRSSSTEVRMSN